MIIKSPVIICRALCVLDVYAISMRYLCDIYAMSKGNYSILALVLPESLS